MSITKLMLAATAAGCLFAVGCVIRPAAEGEVVVGEGPPAVQVEVEGPAPVAIVDPFWITGWWAWDGHWVWHHGYWAHRPHPGAVWVPHEWVRGPRGWAHSGGHWR